MKLRHLLIAFFLVHCGFLLLPKFSQESKAEEGVTCPDGYAIRIPDSDPFAGGYVRCEDYDPFYAAVFRRDLQGARKLLLKLPPTYYDNK